MNWKQLHAFNEHYLDTFGVEPDIATVDRMRSIKTVEQLDEIQDKLSAGEYDCAEAILENR